MDMFKAIGQALLGKSSDSAEERKDPAPGAAGAVVTLADTAPPPYLHDNIKKDKEASFDRGGHPNDRPPPAYESLYPRAPAYADVAGGSGAGTLLKSLLLTLLS